MQYGERRVEEETDESDLDGAYSESGDGERKTRRGGRRVSLLDYRSDTEDEEDGDEEEEEENEASSFDGEVASRAGSGAGIRRRAPVRVRPRVGTGKEIKASRGVKRPQDLPLHAPAAEVVKAWAVHLRGNLPALLLLLSCIHTFLSSSGVQPVQSPGRLGLPRRGRISSRPQCAAVQEGRRLEQSGEKDRNRGFGAARGCRLRSIVSLAVEATVGRGQVDRLEARTEAILHVD